MKRGRPAGWFHTEESKKIMSDNWHTRKQPSAEVKERKAKLISDLFKGIPKSPEQKFKMSKTRMGLKDSDETKSRKSQARIDFTNANKKLRAELGISYSEACLLMKGEHKQSKDCLCQPELTVINGNNIYIHNDVMEKK